MGLDQYGTARKGEPSTDEDGYTYYEDSMGWPTGVSIQTFRDGWKNSGVGRVTMVSLTVLT